MIDLSRCTTVKSADLKAHKKNSFEISTPDTTYLLYAGESHVKGGDRYVVIICAIEFFSIDANTMCPKIMTAGFTTTFLNENDR
jgi:hypothetical protein